MNAPVELPEHMQDAGEWKEWPRKLEAHLKWGVRQRQVEAFTRNGKLKVWSCPDGTFRLDPDALRDVFGEPGVVQGRDRDLSASERKQRQADAAAPTDPVALMFGKSVSMLEGMYKESIGLLRVVSDPMKTLLDAYASALSAQATRIRELEAQVDESRALQSELADAKQERELSVERHKSNERRRDETLTLLKEQVPSLMKQYLEGNSLSAFAKRAPRDVVEAVVDSGTISATDAEFLRREAGIPPKPTTPNPNSNGVVDHGHS